MQLSVFSPVFGRHAQAPTDRRHEDVEEDDRRDGVEAQHGDQHHTGRQEEVADRISTPPEALELEREHPHGGDEQPRHRGHGEDEQLSAEIETRAGVNQPQRRKEEGIGRSREAAELLMLRLVDVELRQPQRREGRHGEAHDRIGITQEGLPFVQRTGGHRIEHRRGNKPERNHVGQRVELHADRGTLTQQACDEPVEKVEHGGQHHEPESPFEVVVDQCRKRREGAAHEVRQRQQIGDGEEFDFHCPDEI